MTDSAAQLIGHYKIVREIGRGGMSRVYRGTDTRSGRDVALKTPGGPDELSPDILRRFLREVRVVSRLVHPNIVALVGGFDHAGAPWLVFELAEGPTLGAWIDAHGPMPAVEVVRHGAGLASALALAHARGVLHGDISPTNIVLAEDGRAKLLDFGLADLLSAPQGGPARSRATVSGTAGYMAPEKILGQGADARSDVFSLGAVLYEMATGRPAFLGTGREEILDATLAIEPAEMDRLGALASIVRKALAKSPDERYSSAAAVEGELGIVGWAEKNGGDT